MIMIDDVKYFYIDNIYKLNSYAFSISWNLYRSYKINVGPTQFSENNLNFI